MENRGQFAAELGGQFEMEKRGQFTWNIHLSRLLGIINIIEEQNNPDDMPYLLKLLRISCNELDEITKQIVAESQHIKLDK